MNFLSALQEANKSQGKATIKRKKCVSSFNTCIGIENKRKDELLNLTIGDVLANDWEVIYVE